MTVDLGKDVVYDCFKDDVNVSHNDMAKLEGEPEMIKCTGCEECGAELDEDAGDDVEMGLCPDCKANFDDLDLEDKLRFMDY